MAAPLSTRNLNQKTSCHDFTCFCDEDIGDIMSILNMAFVEFLNWPILGAKQIKKFSFPFFLMSLFQTI